MRTAFIRIALIASAVMTLNLAQAAQIQNPIKAAKDAYNKAKQQQQQQQSQRAQPTPNQATSAASGQPLNSSSEPRTQSGSAATGADCCTPEAMKKIAGSLGFVDIVGVKLGMTPKEAVAAVKAYDPNLKIENLTTRLEHPSGPPGNFVRVPITIKAYTANVRQDLGPVEWIAMRFTLPPGPPLLAKVQRYTGFPIAQPVMVSNLLQSLRKKYGQENFAGDGGAGWVYDSNGKLLTRVSNPQRICPDNDAIGGPGPTPPPGETGVGVNLSNTTDPQNNPNIPTGPETAPDCVPLVWVVANGVGEGFAPNYQQTMMTVTMGSGALLVMSRKATHAWLQAEADAKIKHDNDAAAGRSAPKL